MKLNIQKISLLGLFLLLAVQIQAQFVTTWQTTAANESITIPTASGETYNYTVDWGDSQTSMNQTGDATHTYATAGTYTVTITGTFPRIEFGISQVLSGNNAKIQTIEAWGSNPWTSMNSAFNFCTSLTYNATDTPDLSNVTDMMGMFGQCANFNGNIGSWDVSNVTNMNQLFNGARAFNQDISGWNVSGVTNMNNMFNTATSFNQDISSWNVGAVQEMISMFGQAHAFNQNLGAWDIGQVSNINGIFLNSGISSVNYDNALIGWSGQSLQTGLTFTATGLNYCQSTTQRQSIIDNFGWIFTGDTQACPFVTTWQTTTNSESITIPAGIGTFNYAVNWGDGQTSTAQTGSTTHTYVVAGTYTVSITGTFPHMLFDFFQAVSGNDQKIQSVEAWGDMAWESMNQAFSGCSNLTYNATDIPDLSAVTDLSSMFSGISAFTGNSTISNWNVSTITNMRALFNGTQFNHDISGWNVSSVENMELLFTSNTAFNQNISGWNVSSVTDMGSMFTNTTAFNQDISGWNVSGVADMNAMFNGATAFNQNLGAWDMASVANVSNMLSSSGLSITNYDSTLIGWATQNLTDNLTLGATGLTYCAGATERQTIITSDSWTITGDSQECPFVTTWQTTAANEDITIPTNFGTGTFNYTVNWGDGQTSTGQTGNATHTYATAGTYTVSITGAFPHMRFDFFQTLSGNDQKIQSVEAWGDIAWGSMNQVFSGCSNLTYNATDVPNLAGVTDMHRMFSGVNSFTGNSSISTWNVSTITNMSNMFLATAFNQDISGWNVSAVTDMSSMFASNTAFNQDISGWDVSNVTDMGAMLSGATSFNQNISGWNVSSVGSMNTMFQNASSFDQNLGAWDMTGRTGVILMLNGSGLSQTNYDNTLIGWAGQTLQNSLTLGATGLNYCLATAERQSIIDNFSWTITDAGASCSTTPTIWNGTAWDNGTPTASSVALIEGNYNSATNGSFVTDELWVKSGNTLNIDGGFSISTTGNLYNYGTVSVASDNSFIQTASAPINDGNGVYEVKREGADYHGHYNYWSSPVQNTAISDVFGNNGKSFYTFDSPTQAWQGASRTATLNTGSGFTATGTSNTATTITRTFSDSVGFNSGDITQSLYYSGSFHADSNWHLLGNPYPSGLDVNQFITDNTALIENAVYLWSSDGSDYTSSNADYATMNSMGTVNAGGSGVAPSSATISSTQGFFVQSKASGNLTFSNSQRVATNNTFLRTTSDNAKIWLGVENENGVSNELLIGFMADAEEGKNLYDASKFSGNDFVSLYSIGDFKSEESKLAIQGLPSLGTDRIIPIGIEAKEAGEFTFRINNLEGFDAETEVFLYDLETESLIDLRAGDYKVNLEKGEFNERFELRFVGGKITGIADDLIETGVSLHSSGNRLFINFANLQSAEANIAVYDLTGRLVLTHSNQQKTQLTLELPNSGIYIVRVENGNGVVSKKLFVE